MTQITIRHNPKSETPHEYEGEPPMSAFWQRIEARRRRLKISRAEMARRAGISESTVNYGLKRGSRPSGAVRRQVELVLALEEQVQTDMAAEAAAAGTEQAA